MLIRSVSGVRGLTAGELTPILVRKYGKTFALQHEGDIAVGWDSRRGGRELVDAVAQGIREAGANPIDLGVVPTPTVGMVVRGRGLAGGVVVTASHNPEDYNGLKFFSANGVFLESDEVARLFDAVDSLVGVAEPPVEKSVSGTSAGASDGTASALDEHIDLVLSSSLVDIDAVRRARPRIVMDCVNGAGSVMMPRLLRELGCEVKELFTAAGSGFLRGAEPIPEHLGELSRVVVECKADAGFACDPDADRLAVVDESGRPIGEEYTLAIAARVVLEIQKGPVVANVSTSRMLDDLAGEFGVPIHRTRIGEINVVAKMLEVDAVVGGEGNGGVILPDVHMGRDSATAAALVVTGMARSEAGTVSGLAAQFTRYSSIKTKMRLDSATREGIVEAMKAAFPDGELDLTDGAKIAWSDRWVHARMSGTEPVVRVIAEATSDDAAERLVNHAVSAVKDAAEGA